MFDCVGSRIKSVAIVGTVLGIIASVVVGIVIMDDDIFIGITAMAAGTIASWLGSLTLYGFGELIENSNTLVKLLKTVSNNENANGRTAAQNANGRTVAQDEWKCGCGRINRTYVTTCVCGRHQFEKK